MAVVALASAVCFIVVGGLVGVKLLLLARRTRQLPELTVGLGFFFVALIGYPLALVAISPSVEGATAGVCFAVGTVATTIGSISIFVFTWRVFRPDATWAAVLASACMVALAVIGGLAVHDVLSGAAAARDAYLVPRQCVSGFSYAWTAVEGLRWYGMQRRRLALGLADPRVANRFLLWGLSGVFATLGVAVSTAVALAGDEGVRSAVSMLAIGVAGFATSITIYLAFVPPAAYLRWVAGRTGAQAA